MAELLSLEDAQAAVLERVTVLAAERVPVAEAAGRILVAPAAAAVDLPPFPSSAMDGYAVRAADVPGRLSVMGRSSAGRPLARRVGEGEAAGIATGAVVPDGADAVIPIEYVVEHDNEVEIPGGAQAGAHVRPPGGDIRRGDVVVEAGAVVSPARLGALAAAGVAEVACGGRPRVAVAATGTELRPPGAELEPGQIYEANIAALAAAARSAGASVELLPPAADDEVAHRALLERGLEADVLVTSGGVSVGPHDLVRAVARELGVEEVFWRVAVKPGKPVSFGLRGRTLVFGLPGNPVSALVGFELFVRPALLALQGAAVPGPHYLVGTLAADVRRNGERDELVRARRELAPDRILLRPVVGQESHMIARAAAADALVLVERGEGQVPAGSSVRYLALG